MRDFGVYSCLTLILCNIILQCGYVDSTSNLRVRRDIKSRARDLQVSTRGLPKASPDKEVYGAYKVVDHIEDPSMLVLQLAVRNQDMELKSKSLTSPGFPFTELPKISASEEPSLKQMCKAMKVKWGEKAPNDPAFKRACRDALKGESAFDTFGSDFDVPSVRSDKYLLSNWNY